MKFSFPLIPNSLCWWATISLDKFLILFYLGEGSNGIYAMTTKFSSIITMITSVFILAWQETSIREYSNKDKHILYSSVFNKFYTLLFSFIIMMLPFIKLVFRFLIDSSYIEVIKYIPLSFLGTTISAIASFYGVGYLASGKTRDAFRTTTYGALINFIFVIIFINKIHLYANFIATIISFTLVSLRRSTSMKEYFPINVDKSKILLYISFYVLSVFIYYYFNSIVNLVFLLITILVLIYINKKEIIFLIRNGVKNENFKKNIKKYS